MKIYCAHSSGFDYRKDWYQILGKSLLMSDHVLIFPHDDAGIQSNSYETIKTCDCIVAEVSYHSTGMGIELGWAQTLRKPIFCFHTSGSRPSSSLGAVATACVPYNSPENLIELISQFLSHEMNHAQ